MFYNCFEQWGVSNTWSSPPCETILQQSWLVKRKASFPSSQTWKTCIGTNTHTHTKGVLRDNWYIRADTISIGPVSSVTSLEFFWVKYFFLKLQSSICKHYLSIFHFYYSSKTLQTNIQMKKITSFQLKDQKPALVHLPMTLNFSPTSPCLPCTPWRSI